MFCNALPVPLLRQVHKNSVPACTGVKFWVFEVYFFLKRSIWVTKTNFGDPFGSLWVPLGIPWAPLGDPLGAPWGPLGDPLGPLGDHLGPFLVHFGSFWGLCGHPGPLQGCIFHMFEVFRPYFEDFRQMHNKADDPICFYTLQLRACDNSKSTVQLASGSLLYQVSTTCLADLSGFGYMFAMFWYFITFL